MKWHALTLLAILSVGCGQARDPKQTLTLATTTSTRDSGLLDALLPLFEEQSDLAVKVVAVGSGQALELGRRGDADVLLTHAPAAEQQFMNEGHGELRQPVMYNTFVLVGPPSDPAQVIDTGTICDAFRAIARTKALFVSRADNSGTHSKEQAIWEESAIQPDRTRYIRAGSGMAAALRMANEKQAYILTDRATFLAHQRRLQLAIVSQGDPLLHNPYNIIVLSSDVHPQINRQAARQFAEFLRSPQAVSMIRDFGREQFGQPLFFPRVK